MGRRGPKGKTAGQHFRDGTFRADRHGHLLEGLNLDDAPREMPSPDGLTGDALKAYKSLWGTFGQDARPDQVPLLREWAWWVGELRRAQRALKKATPGSTEYGKLVRALASLDDQVKGYAESFRGAPEPLVKRVLGAAVNGANGNGANGHAPRVRTRPQTDLDREGG